MFLTDNSEDKLSIVHMNSELRHAELELLSAHVATHKLRLRFSPERLARYGRRDVLRKTIETAGALHEYYTSIDQQMRAEEALSETTGGLSEKQIRYAIECLSSYLRTQSEQYLPAASAVSEQCRKVLSPYFSSDLLEKFRVVELLGKRLPNPAFYAEAKTMGFVNLPDFSHLNSVTLVNVAVFNERVTERALFHALVHAVQFEVLGLERYANLFVRSFVNARFHFLVPVEAHAFLLESKFARPVPERFSVEEQVRLWAKQNRY